MFMRALGIIFSDLHTDTVDELTRYRTLASVPFGGRYRLVDFALSNMVNSGITRVGIIAKRNYQSLMDHIGSGKDWTYQTQRRSYHFSALWQSQKRQFICQRRKR